MKTVIDAVNEFKGAFPYHSSFARLIHHAFDLKVGFSDYYGTGVNSAPNSNWYLVCEQDEFAQCMSEMTEGSFVPKASKDMIEAVYTQAMADNGELPSVGMKVLVRGHERVIMLAEDSDGDYITINEEGCYDFDSINQFKPLTPPIELINGKAYQFRYANANRDYVAHYNEEDNLFIVPGYSWSIANCTNIIPLVPAT